MSLSTLLVPPLLFFLLGFGARASRTDLVFPSELSKALSMYLLIGIGLHGGAELANSPGSTAAQAIAAAILLGCVLPVLGYVIVRAWTGVDRLNAAAIAAHYGSVSAGTFLTAIAYLQSRDVSYESYPIVMLAVMEAPAIVVALIMAQRIRQGGHKGQPLGSFLSEALKALRHGSVYLLIGTMVIGAMISEKNLETINPFFRTVFSGALCLFLLELGIDAAKRITDFGKVGWKLGAFGIVMPLIGGILGLAVGHGWLGLGVGGTTLVAVLAASASYIAVPPVIRMAIPEASPSLYLTLSLGITFPFNVVIGIPLYLGAAKWLIN